MAEEGILDFQHAKRKAAERIDPLGQGALPNNQEVELALRDYMQTFQAAALRERLAQRYRLARHAMHKLETFEPRLVGPLLRGIATVNSPVELHVFADSVEELCMSLMDRGLRYELDEKRLRFGGGRYEQIPLCRLFEEQVPIEVAVFVPRGRKEPPVSPVDGKTMRRVGEREMERLAGEFGIRY
jgi:hypothetical protein